MTNSVIRDDKGKFVKGAPSPNKAGRPKNTKGTKHKYSKSKLETMLNKCGLESFELMMQIGKDALSKGDLGTAIKCFVFVGGKYYELTIHNDKILMQEQKKRDTDNEEENSDEGEQFTNVEISFPVFKAV
jgi:hypothetical protein